MSHPNDDLIQRFYTAFGEGRADVMRACYTPDAHFQDPVFPDLNGDEPGRMWTMLLEAPGELRIELVEHDANDETGSARWHAHYVFSQTGRPWVSKKTVLTSAVPGPFWPDEMVGLLTVIDWTCTVPL